MKLRDDRPRARRRQGRRSNISVIAYERGDYALLAEQSRPSG